MIHHYEIQELSIEEKESDQTTASCKLSGSMRQKNLVMRMHACLLHNRNFANQHFNRDELISELATNKTYLFEAVKTVTGKTLQEYIDILRLEEAKLMLGNQPVLTIETIAGDCGFNSSRTFYRLFRERYNTSPAEYRKMVSEQILE